MTEQPSSGLRDLPPTPPANLSPCYPLTITHNHPRQGAPTASLPILFNISISAPGQRERLNKWPPHLQNDTPSGGRDDLITIYISLSLSICLLFPLYLFLHPIPSPIVHRSVHPLLYCSIYPWLFPSLLPPPGSGAAYPWGAGCGRGPRGLADSLRRGVEGPDGAGRNIPAVHHRALYRHGQALQRPRGMRRARLLGPHVVIGLGQNQ